MIEVICVREDQSIIVLKPLNAIIEALMNGGYFGDAPTNELLKREIKKLDSLGIDLAYRWVNSLAYGALSKEEAIALLVAKDCPESITHYLTEDATKDFPRDYRNAWRFNTDYLFDREKQAICHCMETAKAIHKDKLRNLRAPLLRELDVQFMRAVEEGNEQRKAEIVAKKQALRDVTKDDSVVNATTIDALREAIPDCLKA